MSAATAGPATEVSATTDADRPAPVQVRARVVAVEPAGAYRRIVLAEPGIGGTARPGQFVALAVGEAPTAMLLRRSFSLYRASADGEHGPTVEIVVADAGPGSAWVTRRQVGDVVDVLGPLGRPFPLPASPRPVVLVGGGYGSAPLLWLAQELHGSCDVDLVLGAATEGRLFGVEDATATVGTSRVHVTTDDGSAGETGRVTDALRRLLGQDVDPAHGVDVYACGPMAMLRAVHETAAAAGARAWLAVEESMACGVGVCMTCVLPVRHADGVTRMTRTCTDGPTFAGDAVRWDAVVVGPHGAAGLVPPDCLGAPVPAAPGSSSGGH